MTPKGALQGIDRTKAAPLCKAFERPIAMFKQIASVIEAGLFDEARWRLAGLLPKISNEIPLAHSGTFGKRD